MLTVNKLIPGGRGLAPVLVRRAATVTLGWDLRQRSRFDAIDSQDRRVGVFLPRGSVLRGGDVLVLEDGSLLRVVAAPQPVLVVRASAAQGSPFDLLRAAYHLGNRHVPLELKPDHLKLEPDHVLADLMRQMRLEVEEVQAPFEPEAGAYASEGHSHSHSHDHDHDHDHEHGHGRGHGEASQASDGQRQAPTVRRQPVIAIQDRGDAGHDAPHVHGPGCGHDHR